MNIIILRGYLGQDPTIRFFDSGKSVANCTLGVTNPFNKQTTWFSLEVWGKTGEVLANYCKKGSHVLIQGSVKIEEYTTKEGVKQRKTVVVVNELNLLDKKGDNAKTETTETKTVKAEVVSSSDYDGTDIPF